MCTIISFKYKDTKFYNNDQIFISHENCVNKMQLEIVTYQIIIHKIKLFAYYHLESARTHSSAPTTRSLRNAFRVSIEQD